MRSAPIKRVTIHHLAVPLKHRIDHAAARRTISESIVVAIELMNGLTGYGETLPRQYVTGESDESVIRVIGGELVPRLLEFRPKGFAEALEAIDALPLSNRKGECTAAARAAVELALVDAYARFFDRSIDQIPGWMGLASFGAPGSIDRVRYSGVLASSDPRRLTRTARLLWWYGIRHFKLKVAFEDDDRRLSAVLSVLGGAMRRGRATLRLDANGGWSPDQARRRLGAWSSRGIESVEQPLSRHDDDQLAALRAETRVPIVHDESLVTASDARRLIEAGVADGFNIRISKCGGLMPALRLAGLARRHGVGVQLGCMVGETSILSAAGVQFLKLTPGVAQAEGCFGSFLLTGDVSRRGCRFGYGGRAPRVGDAGLGLNVDPQMLDRLSDGRRIIFELG